MIELYAHQQEAVDKLKNGSILCGGVGTGKSITALAYFYTKVCKGVIGDLGSMRDPYDLYIITTAKKRDSREWEKDCNELVLGKEPDASAGCVEVVVDSWNNIAKYEHIENAFFIFDEQRVVGSGAWVKSFYKITVKNKWIMLSATPGDTWLDYIPVFVAHGFYKNRTQFKQEHCVYSYYGQFPKLERYLSVNKLVRLRNEVLVDMPYERHTKRHEHLVEVDYDKELYLRVVKDRWHVYEERPLKDVAELFRVMRKVVNSDSSRLEALQNIITTHPKVIVFYNFDYELASLREHLSDWKMSCALRNDSINKPNTNARMEELTSSTWNSDGCVQSLIPREFTAYATSKDAMDSSQNVVLAEWNGHKHEPIPDSERWVYLVQYVAGAEGWNCVTTDTIVFWSLTYSYKNFHQAKGRIDRMNSPFVHLHYYIMKSKSTIDNAIWKALGQKKSFNERKFGEKAQFSGHFG